MTERRPPNPLESFPYYPVSQSPREEDARGYSSDPSEPNETEATPGEAPWPTEPWPTEPWPSTELWPSPELCEANESLPGMVHPSDSDDYMTYLQRVARPRPPSGSSPSPQTGLSDPIPPDPRSSSPRSSDPRSSASSAPPGLPRRPGPAAIPPFAQHFSSQTRAQEAPSPYGNPSANSRSSYAHPEQPSEPGSTGSNSDHDNRFNTDSGNATLYPPLNYPSQEKLPYGSPPSPAHPPTHPSTPPLRSPGTSSDQPLPYHLGPSPDPHHQSSQPYPAHPPSPHRPQHPPRQRPQRYSGQSQPAQAQPAQAQPGVRPPSQRHAAQRTDQQTEAWTASHYDALYDPMPHEPGLREPGLREPSALVVGFPALPDLQAWSQTLRQHWLNLPPNWQHWLIIGLILAGAVLFLDPTKVISSIVKRSNQGCQEVVQPRSVLSRDQLTQLLTVPERSPKDRLRTVVREPYCLMPSIRIRAGVDAVREAYPLEFDPNTWVIVLYEGDEYAGYRFDPR